MTSAANLYHSVINDVISNVRDAFLDEAVDENVLQELKTLWENKLSASKTIDPPNRAEAQLDARMAAANQGQPVAVPAARGGAGAVAPSVGAIGGLAPQGGAGGPGAQQLVITDPNRLVPVQITIPPQPGNPNSVQRALTVQVPAHALQAQGSTGAILQQILTQAITPALGMPQATAEKHLQGEINRAFHLKL